MKRGYTLMVEPSQPYDVQEEAIPDLAPKDATGDILLEERSSLFTVSGSDFASRNHIFRS